MGLLSFFKRTPVGAAASSAEPATPIAAARTVARRRLIGAVLLLGIGVIAFPLLFETQPRPIPVDIAIEIPRKEGAPGLAMPPPRPAAAAAASAPLAAAAPASVASAPPVRVAPIITERKAEAAIPASAPVPRKAESTPAKVEAVAPKTAKPEPQASPEPEGRFVVQVGAYADANAAREMRGKLEKLGLRTYTQVIETDGGKRTRVRLGPYAGRDDADKAAAQVKAAGLPAVVLTL